MADARAHLSQLLEAALRGGEVLVAHTGTPLVRLVSEPPPAARVLGLLDLPVPDQRFDPLHETELAALSLLHQASLVTRDAASSGFRGLTAIA